MRKKMSFFLRSVALSASLVVIVVFSVAPIGCSSFSPQMSVLQGDFESPKILNFRIADESSVEIEFSKNVQVKNAVLHDELYGVTEISCSAENEKHTVLKFSNETSVGKNYIVEGSAIDSNGNSLTFSIPFVGFNKNMAKVVLSEVRTVYVQAKVKDSEGTSQSVHKGEYAELLVVQGGNLCGLELGACSKGDAASYKLPALEVEAGQFIIVHFRNIEGDNFDSQGIYDELEDDLNLSWHADSVDGVRDLWSSNIKKVFGDCDILYVKNFYDDSIQDALVFSKTDAECFEKDLYSYATNQLLSNNLWPNLTCQIPEGKIFAPNEYFNIDEIKSSASKSICRLNLRSVLENPQEHYVHKKEDWAILPISLGAFND